MEITTLIRTLLSHLHQLCIEQYQNEPAILIIDIGASSKYFCLGSPTKVFQPELIHFFYFFIFYEAFIFL